ncbi:hypothetical protein MOF42_21360, partial [Bacillus haynesii]|uniref:hypothetical protein n=1 Tax=Bacillus haynesii TaxID=1925021 RepID=UPI0022817748
KPGGTINNRTLINAFGFIVSFFGKRQESPDREDGLVDFSNQIAYFGERRNLEFEIFDEEMIE